jgi:hypothetical protein
VLQELARKVWEEHEQHIKQAETKQRKAFDDMLERAKLQGLASMEKKYQDKIKHVNKQMGDTHFIDCQNTTHEYEKRLNTAYEKHRTSMDEQITDMNDLAESLVERFNKTWKISLAIISTMIIPFSIVVIQYVIFTWNSPEGFMWVDLSFLVQ